MGFVPNAVLIGFVNAVTVNIVLGQFATFTANGSDAGHRMMRALDTVLHIGEFDWPTFIIGVATTALILAFERTPLGHPCHWRGECLRSRPVRRSFRRRCNGSCEDPHGSSAAK